MVRRIELAGEGDLIAKDMAIADRSTFCKYIETDYGENVQTLPLRYLPPGTVADLYRVYSTEGDPHAASYNVFHTEFKVWANTLRFRQITDFSDCKNIHADRTWYIHCCIIG